MGVFDLLSPDYWRHQKLDNRIKRLKKENSLLKKQAEVEKLEKEQEQLKGRTNEGHSSIHDPIIEKLITLKSQLDLGWITQEEYNQKRKKLLELE